MQLRDIFRQAKQWLTQTPERALDQAYEAALSIKKLEDDYFNGQPVTTGANTYGESTYTYLLSEVAKFIGIIKSRMTVFQTSRSVLPPEDTRTLEDQLANLPSDDGSTLELIDKPAILFKKLSFIDATLERYEHLDEVRYSSNSNPVPSSLDRITNTSGQVLGPQELAFYKNNPALVANEGGKDSSKRAGIADRGSMLPRSILRTVDRVKQDLDPKAEQEVVRNFRKSQGKTKVALRFLLLLIIVPLLTQQLSKNLLVGPVIDLARKNVQADIFLNEEMEEEALHELQRFEEKLRFEVLLDRKEALTDAQITAKVRDKALDLEKEYEKYSGDAVKNVFSDIIAAFAFGVLLTLCQRQIGFLKSFMDEIVYGLSDSAKAFILILFTDIFVGFHSPHGWEVLLEGIARHFGLPANREFVFLFIATFPVILDTVFKYWIFRYLNRISPSAVATYKNMNE
jgi:CemA family